MSKIILVPFSGGFQKMTIHSMLRTVSQRHAEEAMSESNIWKVMEETQYCLFSQWTSIVLMVKFLDT